MNPTVSLASTRPSSYRREASLPPVTHSRSNPRQLRIERKDNGFGFTLRHFIVYPPEEGSESGPPIQEPMDTIFVKSVKDQGPAVVAGLNIGDRIVSVNGETVSGRSYAQVVQMIQKSRDSLFLVVVPRQDDVLQVYFSDIAQNPESNKRLEVPPVVTMAPNPGPTKPPWPASVCSSSTSRESSPFSSKTSDSTRDSVYGHNKDYFSGSFRREPTEVRGLYPNSGSRRHPVTQPQEGLDHIYDTIGPPSSRKGDRLSQFLTSSTLTVPNTSHSSSSEHVYSAIPALASSSRSSSSTLASGASQANQSRDSLDSDSSVMAGFTSKPEEKVIDKIKKDCERKEEFLRNTSYPAYLSSPPKDIDQSPYGIASLASTMPPPTVKEEPPVEEPPPKPPAKNFFMDIYAQEVSKMQSVSKTSAPAKKRNFDATQFNAYGLPLASKSQQRIPGGVKSRTGGVFPLYLNKQQQSSKTPVTQVTNLNKNPICASEQHHSKDSKATVEKTDSEGVGAFPATGVVRRVKSDLERRTSYSSLSSRSDLQLRPLAKSKESQKSGGKSPQRVRKFSLGNVRSRSSSMEAEYLPGGSMPSMPGGSMPLPTVRKESSSGQQKKGDDEKTFSVTILVNEHEKNKIVDLLYKAKTIISKKVEKVIGKKPKSGISNVDALQTVLESWMDREEEEEREDHRIVERLIAEQEKQVQHLILTGKDAPVAYRPLPTVEVNNGDDEPLEEDTEVESDLEVSRLTSPRFLQPPAWKSSKINSEVYSPTRSLSPADHVPCPFGNRPDSELYPPRLRRPSSHYGAGAAAACSRPPSRQVSVSPSVKDYSVEGEQEEIDGRDMPCKLVNLKEDPDEDTDDVDEDGEWEYEEYEAPSAIVPAKYCRPDSFVIPIGGCWNPKEDVGENEIKWGKLESEQDYQIDMKTTEDKKEASDGEEGYRKGNSYENVDAFSRNNYVIVGSRTLHCEPPQVYQPTPEPAPPPPVCGACYGGYLPTPYPYPVPYYTGCCGCGAPCPHCVPVHPCQACAMMTMTAPYQPRPPRPNTLPGIQSLHTYGVRGRHDSPILPEKQVMVVAPVNAPVHMHPDPGRLGQSGLTQNTVLELDSRLSQPNVGWESRHTNIPYRRRQSAPEDEDEKNLRRISYLQATKEERMDVEDNLTNESGLAPTHSIKKLKSIFSEKTEHALPPPPASPRLSETPVQCKLEQSISPPAEQENIREGYLTCKVAVVDGKKANDRSWKTVYAVLKCKALYMFKDKKMALDNLEYEEKPVKLMESEVEVASDYTKRKNVFRVKTDAGSEYLFQAENEGLMKEWVSAIDETAMAIIVDERKDSNKLRKLTSFRNRSPTGQSPASKSRKSSAELLPPFKDKDKKTWKGKVVKQLKKIGGGSHGPLYPEGGSICVPLEECPLCDTEFIPYLVKVCCDIVTERGLDIVGIYRVPGNNAAVTYLTEQVNKGVENFALEDQRWQDVNVVSSLLKSFFRKLPDPLFTVENYSLFIEASKIDLAPRRMDQLRKLVRDLPEIHLETLKYLTSHLCQVAEHSTLNKMEVRNLAIVFGPTLVRTTDDNMVSMVTDMSQQCRIIESILSNWEYFFTEEEVEVKEEAEDGGQPLGTGVSNQSLMLANLHKLEDAGKVGSPKGDVSAKDIVSSIISAANRKMLRAATKGKKESSVECESERGASMSRDRLDTMDGGRHDARRDSEAVIHGALQIASAVPGVMGDTPEMMERDEGTPDMEGPYSYSRQDSLGSLGGCRRGSGCMSKRGSICAYSGGQVCEATPVGEMCETRIAMEMVSNGLGENQEVVTGKLSLVNVPGFPRVTPGLEQVTDHSSSMTCVTSNTLGVTTSLTRPDSAPPLSEPPHTEYKFPIETYAGLDQATAERIAKFEAETKAMLTQRSGMARSSQDLHEVSTSHHHRHAVTSSPATSLQSVATSTPSQNSLRTGSISSLLSSSQDTSLPLSSLTTPVPDSNPLDGGILMEEPYSTEAYDTPLGSQRRFLHLTYRNSLPNLQGEQVDQVDNILTGFDTKKVAAKGTLQRMKVRGRPELHNLGLDLGGTVRKCETVWDDSETEQDRSNTETEKLLTHLTASFDQKMRLLLDPHYQSSGSVTSSSSEGQVKTVVGASMDDNTEAGALYGNKSLNKKQLDEARNILQQVKSAKRVELRRSGRVDKSLEPEKRQGRRLRHEGQQVLRQVNVKRQLNRSDSLTKKEKTEINLRAKAGEKENTVASLRDQFEGKIDKEGQSFKSHRIDVTKLRKKLSDCNNRRIKRRHTVGGTKDFSENVVSLIVRGVSAWDRLAPIISDHESEERRLSLQVEEERRFSLPPVESMV